MICTLCGIDHEKTVACSHEAIQRNKASFVKAVQERLAERLIATSKVSFNDVDFGVISTASTKPVKYDRSAAMKARHEAKRKSQ